MIFSAQKRTARTASDELPRGPWAHVPMAAELSGLLRFRFDVGIHMEYNISTPVLKSSSKVQQNNNNTSTTLKNIYSYLNINWVSRFTYGAVVNIRNSLTIK